MFSDNSRPNIQIRSGIVHAMGKDVDVFYIRNHRVAEKCHEYEKALAYLNGIYKAIK